MLPLEFEGVEGDGSLVSGAYIIPWAFVPPTQKPRLTFGMTPTYGLRLGGGVGGRWAY